MSVLVPLGKIAPAVAGTPQQLVADRSIVADEIIVCQIAGTLGKVCFGVKGLNRTTLAGVVKQFLAPGSSGFLDTLDVQRFTGKFVLADYYVDGDNNNEGLLISYIVD